MMPGVRNLNRTLCVVTRAIGDGFGQFLHTTQISPAPSEQDALLEWIDRKIIPAVASQTGIIRLELAVADKAASRTKTNEQDLRDQPDAVADWVLLAEAFEETALGHFDNGSLLSDREIRAHGGRSPESETFRLAHLLVSG
jgi:hypothetical protein